MGVKRVFGVKRQRPTGLLIDRTQFPTSSDEATDGHPAIFNRARSGDPDRWDRMADRLGLLLLGISLVTNLAGRLVVRRVAGGVLPVGRGV